jgi:transcription antitermination factor NusG
MRILMRIQATKIMRILEDPNPDADTDPHYCSNASCFEFLHTFLFRFEETPEGLDIDIGTGDKEEASSHKFSNGDNVEVVEGELQNLQGRVVAVDGTKITILPKHEDLKDPLDFQAKELRKYFRQVSPSLD